MHSLPVFLRLAGRPVMLIGTGEAAEGKRRLLERAGAIIVGEDATAALAIVVDDDAAVARLRARGVLVNATDRPDLCDFTLPAIVDRDPVLIAIGTGGASAGLAAALRQRIEAMVPAHIGDLACTLYTARARMRRIWPDASARRRAIGKALSPGGAIDPLGLEPNVDAWLAKPAGAETADIFCITLRSADPDDLTVREARMLAQADRVYHQPGMPAEILDRARADASRMEADTPPQVTPDGLWLWVGMRD